MIPSTFVDIPKPRTDERQIWDMYAGKFTHMSLLVAHDLELFPLLATKKLTLAEVGESLKINCRGAEALLIMLVSMGLLQVQDGYYLLTSLAEDYLLEDSPAYFGGFLDLEIQDDQEVENLKKALLANSSSVDSGENTFQSDENDLALDRTFTSAMHSHSMGAALAWPELIDLSGNRLLLDIGGGSGAHTIGATLKWSNLQAVVLDLATVCEVAQEFITRYDLQSRIKTHASNMFSEPFPSADIHFYGSIYHNWLPEKGRFLAQKSFESLEPGGRIIVHEMLFNEQKTSPLVVAAANIIMFLAMESQQYSGLELSMMLKSAGFTEIEVKPTFGYWSIVTGRKPSQLN